MLSIRQTIISTVVAFSIIPSAYAAGAMSISLAPHCTDEDRSTCPAFEVTSPTTISTGKLSAGDILDVDVVVTGSDYKEVREVRSWLNYDPEKLEARSVELTPAITSPTPGEQNIDSVTRSVKIGGSVRSGFSQDTTVIARVTFRVLSTTDDTEISFFDYRDDGIAHTAVNGSRVTKEEGGSLPAAPCIDFIIGCKGTPRPLLSAAPAVLAVLLKDESVIPEAQAAELLGNTSSSAMSVSSAMSSSMSSDGMASSASSLAGAGSTFTILQVQGLKVTTRDTSVFLGWNDLKSSELTGYNVYYGTVSGRYMQRRSIPASEASLVLRDLQIGTTYYFAVRGVNAQNQETVFSQEVSVTVGKPETATSPLTGSVQDLPSLPDTSGQTPSNMIQTHGGQTIGGNTGVSDTFFMLFGISAMIGTFFAFRRQLSLSHVR